MKQWGLFIALVALVGVGAVIAVQQEDLPGGLAEEILVVDPVPGPWRMIESNHGLFLYNQDTAQVFRFAVPQEVFSPVQVEELGMSASTESSHTSE